jgi:uncharacterized caspase-like protein
MLRAAAVVAVITVIELTSLDWLALALSLVALGVSGYALHRTAGLAGDLEDIADRSHEAAVTLAEKADEVEGHMHGDG